MKRNIVTSTDTLCYGDDVVIQKLIADIPGGRTIDFTGWNGKDGANVIPAGTVIIKGTVNSAVVFRPHPVASTTEGGVTTWAYDTITSGFTVAGILYHAVTSTNNGGSIAIDAVVNETKLPYALTSGIKAALPNIKLITDEEA